MCDCVILDLHVILMLNVCMHLKLRGGKIISIPPKKKIQIKISRFSFNIPKNNLVAGFCFVWSLMVSVEKWFLFYIRMFFCNSLHQWTLFSLL